MIRGGCLCGAGADYSVCCGSFLLDKRIPLTPEELMRSRYSAYALANIDYIKKTMREKARADFDESNAKLGLNQ